MKTALITLLFLIVGCQGSDMVIGHSSLRMIDSDSYEGTQDERFSRYVAEFEDMFNVSASHVDIFVGSTYHAKMDYNSDQLIAGVCIIGANITIKIADYVTELDSDAKRNIIFHELGHCVLGLEHKSGSDHVMSTDTKREAFSQFLLDEMYEDYMRCKGSDYDLSYCWKTWYEGGY